VIHAARLEKYNKIIKLIPSALVISFLLDSWYYGRPLLSSWNFLKVILKIAIPFFIIKYYLFQV
jgi:hypothetical protein